MLYALPSTELLRCFSSIAYDHFEWDIGEKEDLEHFYLLQEKINLYLGYSESGQLLEDFPNAKNRDVVFEFQLLYTPDRKGEEFLTKAEEVVVGAGFQFKYCYVGDRPEFQKLKEE